MKNIWSIALSPITATANQRGHLVSRQHPDSRHHLQCAEDERDPAPGPRVAEHVVRVGHEHVRISNRGDAIDQIEASGDKQQDGREQHQAVAAASYPAAVRAPGRGGSC